MRGLLTVLLLFIYTLSFGQIDTIALKAKVKKLDQALVKFDRSEINKLVDPKVSFGHSNGWVQESLVNLNNDLKTGYLVYNKIESSDIKISVNKDWANVRMNAEVKGKVNEKDFELKLHILQVWKKVKGEWKLIARQSTKVL